MKYWDGYKYVVAETFTVATIITGHAIVDRLTELAPDGTLTIQQGYPWDGNSGPCVDWESTVEASCIHDVLCDYVNMGWLPAEVQPLIDQEYYRIATKKGFWEILARLRLMAIRWYMAGKGAKRYTRKVLEA